MRRGLSPFSDSNVDLDQTRFLRVAGPAGHRLRGRCCTCFHVTSRWTPRSAVTAPRAPSQGTSASKPLRLLGWTGRRLASTSCTPTRQGATAMTDPASPLASPSCVLDEQAADAPDPRDTQAVVLWR